MPETRNRLVGRTVPVSVDGLGLWQIAPAPLAKVEDDGAIHWNPACRAFLQDTLGGSPLRWRRWLHAVLVRLRTSGQAVELVPVGAESDAKLEVRLGARRPGDRFRLVGLAHPSRQGGSRVGIVEAVATLSHELRTPLASMLSSLDLLANEEAGPMNGDQLRFLNLARRNIGRLDRLVTDLLDLPFRPGTARTPYRTLVDLGDLVRDVTRSHAAACAAEDQVLDTRDVPAHLPAQVDPDQARRMVHNILGNAVKYAGKGGRIRVSLEAGEGFAGAGVSDLAAQLARPLQSVRITIEDDGPGVAPDRIEEMFRPFVRGSDTTARGIPGAGLGLHITRQMVRAHGGRIRMDGAMGQGLTVSIDLPRNRSTELLCKGRRGLDKILKENIGGGRSMIAVFVTRRGAEHEDAAADVVRTFLEGIPEPHRKIVVGPEQDLGLGTVAVALSGVPDAHRWHEAWVEFQNSGTQVSLPGTWRFLSASHRARPV